MMCPQKKLSIYLGDFVHNFITGRDIWTIPLNVASIAAYTDKFFKEWIKVKIFKFPDQFLAACSENPPDIIGVSNYMWNFELSKAVIKKIKRRFPACITVMGGPNVTQTVEEMTKVLSSMPLDFYVSLFGEEPFKSIVEAVLKGDLSRKELHNNSCVQGVWYLDPKTGRACLRHSINPAKDLDTFPSPFTGGYLDEAFEQDLFPMIETNRGCPFPCTFCDWGSAGLGKITKYSVERIIQDLKYIQEHTRDERLMIADANFGILGERDLKIAEFIQHLNETTGYPEKMVITWAQSKNKTTLKIGECLKKMFMVTTSFQSMNEETLKAIKRKNIDDEQFKKNMSFCKKNNIETYGELMVPLPLETLKSHHDAIRYYFEHGIDFININPVILLEGAELNTQAQREKYGFKTKWRLMENCYGEYDKTPVIEYDEMVIETNSMSWNDFILCRPISWLIHMSWNLKRHDLLLKFLQAQGINVLDFIIRAIRDSATKAPPKVKDIFGSFLKTAKNEYFETKEKLIEYYSQPENLEKLRQGAFQKLNIHYAGRVSSECSSEFIDYYQKIAKDLFLEKGIDSSENIQFIHECCTYMKNRFLNYEDFLSLMAGENINKQLFFKTDILRWSENTAMPIKVCRIDKGVFYNFFIEERQRETLMKHLNRFKGLSKVYQMSKLQETVHGMHKKNLLYQIKSVQ